MKILLLPALLFIAIIGHSQKIKVDKITGDTTIVSSFEKLYGKASFSGTVGEQVKVVASKEKTGYSIGLFVQTAKSLSFTVTGLMRIKLVDGSVIDLKPAGSGAREIANDISGGSSITVFQLSDENRAKLQAIGIQFIRLEGDGLTLEYDIKDKNQFAVADCLKKLVPSR